MFCSYNDIHTFDVTDILINMTVAPPISMAYKCLNKVNCVPVEAFFLLQRDSSLTFHYNLIFC